ncbi:sensor histidine kinase [Bradyrhizobium sp. DOA1]|uniref:sensor histidine kinase n=1 Tax=Bradyrhizobium sp. DOA1 TaxID=1126616 RepID=UPI00077CD736|nr:sensor histidine kinase [Bradyrhizobium sp. DOA1]
MNSLSELPPDGSTKAERLLLRELASRIDDELASAIDLVSKATDRCDAADARITLASVRDRLANHARLHHALQMPEFTTIVDLAAYLRLLCRSISRASLESEGITLSLLLHPLKVNSEQCWLLGVIVFELITGLARCLSRSGTGIIHLEMWGTATSIVCCMTDGGTSGEDWYRGETRDLVEMLAARLQGTIDICADSDGRRIMVSVPR